MKPEVSLWRNYDEGMVGIELDDGTRHLVPPEDARAMAADFEDKLPVVPEQDRGELERFISDLRAYATEVEQTAGGDADGE